MAFLPSSAESMFRNHDHQENHFPSSSPQDFHGVSELLMMRRSMSFSGMERAEEFQPDDDGSDDGSHMALGEKKRRLNLEQVKALEKSFELGNKLEPDRKMQLARALGLQPRQIAIWFQNRRARWKTKQLEKDYDVLKRQFDALKADNEALKSHNDKLQTQLMALKTRDQSNGSCPINLNKDNNEGSWSNGSDTSCEVNLNTPSTDTTLLFPHHKATNKRASVFPPAIGTATTGSLTHLLHAPNISDECFTTNMFGGIEENPNFWPWPEQPDQQNFH